MDFISGTLFNGQRLRALTLTDEYSREGLANQVDGYIGAESVVGTMTRIFQQGHRPVWPHVNSRPKFASRAIDHLTY